jgi:SAM-dependent methyltransferase
VEGSGQHAAEATEGRERQRPDALASLLRREPLRAWSPSTTDLPWGDPVFSERMLAEHLDQGHDLASRRLPVVEKQVDWLVERLELGPGDRVLDLGCGPGLYAAALGRRGVVVTGVDVGPAAIREARARCAGLPCSFVCCDMRTVALEEGSFDTAMILFGQLAVQRPAEAEALLHTLAAALTETGKLVVEVADASTLDRASTLTWWTGRDDLWGEGEHLVLHEHGWDEHAEAVVDRYHVVDAETGRIDVLGVSEGSYPPERLATALGAAGFSPPAVHRGWDGIAPDALGAWIVAVAGFDS